MSHGRTRREAKLDTEKEFDDMIRQGPTERAKWHMRRKPYQAHCRHKEGRALREYGSVAEFYEARLKRGGGAGGQGAGQKGK